LKLSLRYKLPNFEVDANSRQIVAGDASLSLQRRPMDVLLLMLANHDQVVSRELLLSKVWNGRVVTDAVVDQAVLKVRRAIEAVGGDSRIIQTVHGVGYRINAQVQIVEQPDSSGTGFQFLLSIPNDGSARVDSLHISGTSPPVRAQDRVFEFDHPDRCLEVALRLAGCPGREHGLGIHVHAPAVDHADDGWRIVTALAESAHPGQILMSAFAFEWCRHNPPIDAGGALHWMAHGPYVVDDTNTVLGVFELLPSGGASVSAPAEGRGLHRSPSEDLILGWRPAEELEIPGRPDWTLDHQLGEGGLGETWLATNRRSGQQRALKFCFQADHLRSLRREVAVIERLEQRLGERDDIAPIQDWNFDKPPYFIASEYAPHGDLEVWAEARGGLDQIDLGTRLALVAQVAEAVSAAHSAGVLHKDIKPGNILIRMAGDHPRAVLTDFGIGLLSADELLLSQDRTRSGQADYGPGSSSAGTTVYMAPEVLEGKPPGPATDIYALGVLLYQAVIGDFRRVLAPGWERDITDEVLRADIAEMVDGHPARRVSDAGVVADRLARLPERRRERNKLRRIEERLERERRRRKVLVPVLAGVTTFAIVVAYQGVRLYQVAGEAQRQAELAAERAATAEATRSFLIGLFESTDPLAGESADMTARALLDRGAERVTQTLAGQPQILADMLDALGEIYKNLGQHEQAQRYLEQALAIRDSELPPKASDLGDTLFRLGDLAYQQGSFEAGEAYLRRAIDLQASLGERARGDLAWSHYKLSHVLRRLGRAVEARNAARLAMAIAEESGASTPAQVGRMQSALASVYWLEGQLTEARRHFEQAIETTATGTGPQSSDSAAVLAKAAAVLGELGAWHEQDLIANRALEIDLRLLGEEHLFVGEVETSLASALAGQQRFDEAEDMFLDAIATLERTVGEHPSLATALTAYGRMKEYQGEFSRAQELFERGLAIRLSRLGPDHLEVAHSHFELAQNDLAEDLIADASHALTLAGTISLQNAEPGHWLPYACDTLLAYVELRNGDFPEALDHAERAHSALVQALGDDHSLVRQNRLIALLARQELGSSGSTDRSILGEMLSTLDNDPASAYLVAFTQRILPPSTPDHLQP